MQKHSKVNIELTHYFILGLFEYIFIVLKVNDNIVVSCELKCGYENNLKLGLDVYLCKMNQYIHPMQIIAPTFPLVRFQKRYVKVEKCWMWLCWRLFWWSARVFTTFAIFFLQPLWLGVVHLTHVDACNWWLQTIKSTNCHPPQEKTHACWGSP